MFFTVPAAPTAPEPVGLPRAAPRAYKLTIWGSAEELTAVRGAKESRGKLSGIGKPFENTL